MSNDSFKYVWKCNAYMHAHARTEEDGERKNEEIRRKGEIISHRETWIMILKTQAKNRTAGEIVDYQRHII